MPMDNVDQVGRVLGSPFEASTSDFLAAINESATLPIGIDATEAASVVFCTLLERLDLEQARELLDALPPGVQQIIGSCPVHGGEPGEAFGKREFLSRIAQHFELAPEYVEPMARAVLHAVRAQLPPHPATNVENQLPDELAAMWLGVARL